MPASPPPSTPAGPRVGRLIDLSAHPAVRDRGVVARFAARLAGRALAADWIDDYYRECSAATPPNGTPAGFFRACVERLPLTVDVDESGLLRIPSSGPVVVVANHPFGGADAIVLAALLTAVRDDVRILANHLLVRIPEAAPVLIPVDPFGRDGSARRNLGPLRAALAHLDSGGLLATFPAGEVAAWSPRTRRVADRPWSRHVASLVRRSGAAVVPVWFEGTNSALFHAAGLIHPLLRTVLLPHELRRRAGRVVRVSVGRPISPHRLSGLTSDQALIERLRLHVELLGEAADAPVQRTRLGTEVDARSLEPIVPPEPRDRLEGEIAALPAESLLVEQDEWKVFIAEAGRIPAILREIGRLREATFRRVGEGTGRAIDLDSFDGHYRHLFLWNARAGEIAGAYRIGATDEILGTHGIRGLYTRSLFRYSGEFMRRLDPALELGRSFIVEKYQRKLASLLLLWRGIGEHVVRHPRYRILFGPVSISQTYHALSRNLLVRFMRERLSHPALARLVKATHPPEQAPLRHLDRSRISESLRDIEDVSAVISEIEADGKGVPILIKHYVRMSAALLSFNVDREFSGVIDGLMVADLCETDPRLLRRYLGDKGSQSFLQWHRARSRAPAAAGPR